MVRASDGKLRIDAGNISVITDPKAQHAIILDHLNKEARLLPMQPAQPGALPAGAAAASFAVPSASAMGVEDLGKKLIAGHEVDGKRYIIQPPKPPQAPQIKIPGAPGMPPGMPQRPQPAQMATTAEVWTSTKLGLPVLTKVTSASGQLTCACKAAPAAEPHPALFQIPPEYKPVMPPAPSVPKAS
jgi:hypothetical protein